MPYINYADMRLRVPSEETWLQLFDVDEDGTVDTSSGPDKEALDFVISASQSIVDTELQVAFPEGLNAQGQAIDERVKGYQVMIALYERVRYNPLSGNEDNSLFRKGYDDAISGLTNLRKALGARLKTGASAAAPRNRTGSVQNTIAVDQQPTNSYSRSADGRDRSGF